jgi:hypothetical protein
VPGEIITIEREHARTAREGLYLRDGLPFKTWVGIGRRISDVSVASGWWIGDWLVYGQDTYGEGYRRALEATRLDYQTLRNYAWIARRFPPSRRRVGLSLQHHAEVAALPEAAQDLWLLRAERLGWSRNQLRRRLLEQRRVNTPAEGDEQVTCRLTIGAGRQQRWREAAGLCEQEFAEWMIRAVDSAADEILLGRQRALGQGPVEAASSDAEAGRTA